MAGGSYEELYGISEPEPIGYSCDQKSIPLTPGTPDSLVLTLELWKWPTGAHSIDAFVRKDTKPFVRGLHSAHSARLQDSIVGWQEAHREFAAIVERVKAGNYEITISGVGTHISIR